MGHPLTKSAPIGADQERRDISRILRRSVKFHVFMPLLKYSAIWQRYSKGGPPLKESRSNGAGQTKREISRILRRPLKYAGLISRLNYSVI